MPCILNLNWIYEFKLVFTNLYKVNYNSLSAMKLMRIDSIIENLLSTPSVYLFILFKI